MELRHVRYFMAVAEDLHFGNAARRLHVAQPALSVQIRQLEAMLGGDLLHRDKQSVRLTEAGRLFYVEAGKILDQAAHAETVAKAALKGNIATLEIGYSGSAAFSSGLKRVIDAIRRSGPEIEISLRELDPTAQLEALLARRIHFGFMTTTRLSHPTGISSISLESWPLRLAMPRSHRLAGRKRIGVTDIADEEFIVYAANDSHNGEIHFPVGANFNPRISRRVSSGTMVVPIVAAGMGIALIPSSLADMHSGNDVTFRPVIDIPERLNCSLIFLPEQHEPAVRRALSNLAVEFGCPSLNDEVLASAA